MAGACTVSPDQGASADLLGTLRYRQPECTEKPQPCSSFIGQGNFANHLNPTQGKIMNWYLEVLKKYAVFSGRARRREYWFFVLFNILISIALGLVDLAIGTFDEDSGIGLLGGIYALAVLLPSIAVAVRRLHDTGRSGWWFLLVLIPLVGPLVLLVFMLFDSEPGTNQYGDNPKQGFVSVS
jgi:uncharacterized membrane protein YhaH (DUF805 family)